MRWRCTTLSLLERKSQWLHAAPLLMARCGWGSLPSLRPWRRFGSGRRSESTYVTSSLRSAAGVQCFSARCLDTLTPFGCRAYLQRVQIRAGSRRFSTSPSLLSFRARSVSCKKLQACCVSCAIGGNGVAGSSLDQG